MTEAELLAVEERAKAATPGPWIAEERWDGHAPFITAGPYNIARIQGSQGVSSESLGETELANALFIAAARFDVPALVAEVRRLRALVDNADARETQLRERIAEAMDF